MEQLRKEQSNLLTPSVHYDINKSFKEAIHIRLRPNNIKRDGGIEIPQAWMPMIKKHNSQLIVQQTAEGTTSSWTTEGTTSSPNNNEDRNAPIAVNQHKHKQSTSSPDED